MKLRIFTTTPSLLRRPIYTFGHWKCLRQQWYAKSSALAPCPGRNLAWRSRCATLGSLPLRLSPAVFYSGVIVCNVRRVSHLDVCQSVRFDGSEAAEVKQI
jgi:hypothetical protein